MLDINGIFIRTELIIILLHFLVDLRKFRSYHGSSVRDLLRAMRNKVI